MIDLYTGTPGSGKSLHASERIYWCCKMKRPCICNFNVNSNSEYLTCLSNEDLTVDFLVNYAKQFWNGKKRIKEDYILLIIDECQLMFNAREWNKSGRDKWLSFFTQHRKYGYHIILVAQFDGMVDKQIRSLIEYQYIHRKVSNFGLMGKIMSVFSLGKLFVSVRIWYPMSEKIDSSFFSAKKKYYRLYDTFLTWND